jgi:hypothetical protein
MPSPIETNAAQILKALFDLNPADGVYPEGKDLKEATGLAPRDINDAIDYLDSQQLIERLNYSGTSPYHFGGIILNVHGKQRYYEQNNKKKTTRKPSTDKSKMIKVFISHSSKDAEVAEKLIQLIRAALNLKVEDIRCTSVNGYRLPGGAKTDAHLQIEIYKCELLIGLVSSDSMNSHYTLFELGARWGAKKPMIPLLIDNKGAGALKGPLSGINALDAYEEAQLMQFVTDSGNVLKIAPEQPSSYHVYIKSLIASLPNATIQDKAEAVEEEKVVSDELNDYANADRIIKESCEKEWPDDFHMQGYSIDKQRKAVKVLQKGKPADIPQKQFESIRKKAALEWPDDFHMRAYEEEKQFKAWRNLQGK